MNDMSEMQPAGRLLALNWRGGCDPLPMPRQELGRPPLSSRDAGGIDLRARAVVVSIVGATICAAGLFFVGLHEALALQNGGTILHYVFLAIATLLFGWIAFGAANSVVGAVATIIGHGRDTIRLPGCPTSLNTKTALLFPVFHEDPRLVASRIAELDRELTALGLARHFSVFVLSDSQDKVTRESEFEVFSQLASCRDLSLNVSYRNRAENVGKKAGNIQDWVESQGGSYSHFVIFDADSVMSGTLLCRLAAAMELKYACGLIQTVPRIINPTTVFAAFNAFASNVYGPVFAAGFASWQGSTGNYWGHNAIIRTRAFASSAGLPLLSGQPPWGGHIRSHDFVEAALLRRAGWRIDLVTSAVDSQEEGPPTLLDMAVRDRRWMQGNMQHLAVLSARGFAPISRVHLAFGIISYASSAMWALMLGLGLWLSWSEQASVTAYFPDTKSLFPTWPTFDPQAGLNVLIGTAAVLLLPKLAGLVVYISRSTESGYGAHLRAAGWTLAETLFSALIAPVMMAIHVVGLIEIFSGIDSGWKPQRRHAGMVALLDVLRFHAGHVVAGLALFGAAYAISLHTMLWFSPVIAGLVLSPVTTWLSSRHLPCTGTGD